MEIKETGFYDLSGKVLIDENDMIDCFYKTKSFDDALKSRGITNPGELVLCDIGFNISLSDSYFNNCKLIEKLTIENRLLFCRIKSVEFKNCHIKEIELGRYLNAVPKAVMNNPYAKITNNSLIQFKDNVFYSTDFELVLLALNNSENITLDPRATIINEEAFKDADIIKFVTGENIKEIDTNAFSGSGILEINFPNLESISRVAFANTNITEIYAPKLNYIAPDAFDKSKVNTLFIETNENTDENILDILLNRIPKDITVYSNTIPEGHLLAKVKKSTIDNLIDLGKNLTQINEILKPDEER